MQTKHFFVLVLIVIELYYKKILLWSEKDALGIVGAIGKSSRLIAEQYHFRAYTPYILQTEKIDQETLSEKRTK